MNYLLLSLVILTACNPSKELGSTKFKQGSSSNFAPLIPKKIDASKLVLYELSTVNETSDGITSGSIGFEASDFTQWIEVKSCPSSGPCSTGTAVTQRVSLPPFEPGPVEVSLRGCIESKYALDPKTNCGEWISTRYNQPDTSSPFRAQLLREEANRITAIETTVIQLKVLSEIFAKEMETCEKNAAKVTETRDRGRLIVGLLGLGEVLAGKAVSFYFKKNPIKLSSGIDGSSAVDTAKKTAAEAASTTATSAGTTATTASNTASAAKSAATAAAGSLDPSTATSASDSATNAASNAAKAALEVAEDGPAPKRPSFIDSSLKNLLGKVNIKGAFEGISTASDKLGGIASPVGFIKQGASALGLFQGGNPISAFGAVGGAIYGAFNANNLVAETCTARERYEANGQALILRLKSDRFLLQGIHKQLEKDLP